MNSAVRSVVIVLLDPTSDRGTRFFHAAIFRRPDFLFLQAAMEPFDVAVAFRMIRRAALCDASRFRVSMNREEVNICAVTKLFSIEKGTQERSDPAISSMSEKM